MIPLQQALFCLMCSKRSNNNIHTASRSKTYWGFYTTVRPQWCPRPRLQCQGFLTSVLDLALAGTCETVPPIWAFVQLFMLCSLSCAYSATDPEQGPGYQLKCILLLFRTLTLQDTYLSHVYTTYDDSVKRYPGKHLQEITFCEERTRWNFHPLAWDSLNFP